MVQNKDDDTGGPAPVKEEDAVMYRLYHTGTYEDPPGKIGRGAGAARFEAR